MFRGARADAFVAAGGLTRHGTDTRSTRGRQRVASATGSARDSGPAGWQRSATTKRVTVNQVSEEDSEKRGDHDSGREATDHSTTAETAKRCEARADSGTAEAGDAHCTDRVHSAAPFQ